MVDRVFLQTVSASDNQSIANLQLFRFIVSGCTAGGSEQETTAGRWQLAAGSEHQEQQAAGSWQAAAGTKRQAPCAERRADGRTAGRRQQAAGSER